MDGGGRLGPLMVAQVREPVVQPGEFGVGELPDLGVHRGDDRGGSGLVLPLGVGGGFGGGDGAGLADLARCGMAGQVLAQCGEVGQRDAGQSAHGGLDVGWHAQVQDEQRSAADLCPGRPHRPGGHEGRGGSGGCDQEVGVSQRGRHVGGLQGLPPTAAATSAART